MPQDIREEFLANLATPLICEKLFAQVPDIVFCIKNLVGSYITANQAFAERLGLRSTNDIIGKNVTELFPAYLADIYQKQDEAVLNSGLEIIDQLELVSNKHGGVDWHLASKLPLKSHNGEIVGLASISRDLLTPNNEDQKFAGLAKTVEYIQANYGEDLKTSELAAKIELSPTQLDRRMKKIFKLSTIQFIRKVKIQAATQMLKNKNLSISAIAHECGYADQSAFTRKFKATVGLTPGEFRNNR